MFLVTGELSGAASSALFLIMVWAALYGEIRSVKVWSVRRVPRVIIMTHRGKEIRLPTFPGGLLRLFNSLAAAWEQGKAIAEGPPGQAR